MTKFLTVRDLCNIFGVSESTIRRWLRKKILPEPVHGFCSGMKLLWAQSVITSWAEQRASPPVDIAPPNTAGLQHQQRECNDWQIRQDEAAKKIQFHREQRQRTARSKAKP
jgi:predicted DNA-binding transcriptional regulator AlpA